MRGPGQSRSDFSRSGNIPASINGHPWISGDDGGLVLLNVGSLSNSTVGSTASVRSTCDQPAINLPLERLADVHLKSLCSPRDGACSNQSVPSMERTRSTLSTSCMYVLIEVDNRNSQLGLVALLLSVVRPKVCLEVYVTSSCSVCDVRQGKPQPCLGVDRPAL